MADACSDLCRVHDPRPRDLRTRRHGDLGRFLFLLLYVGIALVVLQAGYLAVAYLVIGRRRDRPAHGDPGAPEPTRDMMTMRTLRGPTSGERR